MKYFQASKKAETYRASKRERCDRHSAVKNRRRSDAKASNRCEALFGSGDLVIAFVYASDMECVDVTEPSSEEQIDVHQKIKIGITATKAQRHTFSNMSVYCGEMSMCLSHNNHARSGGSEREREFREK